MKTDYFLGISEEGFHRVVYTEWGDAKSPHLPLICVHGLTRNGRDFDALANYLSARELHLYCPDIVGRGMSDWLKNPLHYTYEQYIADMTALIARTESQAINWLGTSMGGLIGMIMASLPNSPIKRLILNDVGPQIPLKALTRLAQYVGADPDFPSLSAAEAYFKTIYADFGELTQEEWRNLTLHSVREISPQKFVSRLDQNVKHAQAKSKIAWKLFLNPHKALEGTFFDIDLWQIWRKVTCPVLVIHGRNSDLLLPETIEKMQALHANMQVLEVANAGHAPFLNTIAQQEAIYQWLLK